MLLTDNLFYGISEETWGNFMGIRGKFSKIIARKINKKNCKIIHFPKKLKINSPIDYITFVVTKTYMEIRTQPPMTTENFLINNCSNWQTVETISKRFPQFHIISSFTLIIKA
jgi:hypothetical protein